MCEMQCIHYSFIHTVSFSIFIITPAIFNYDEWKQTFTNPAEEAVNVQCVLKNHSTGNWLLTHKRRFRVHRGFIFLRRGLWWRGYRWFERRAQMEYAQRSRREQVKGLGKDVWKIDYKQGLEKKRSGEKRLRWSRKGGLQQDIKSGESTWQEKRVEACAVPSSVFLSSLRLCLSALIFWNSTAIAWRVIDISGCPAPLLISIHTCPLSPEAKGKACQERPWPYSMSLLWPI